LCTHSEINATEEQTQEEKKNATWANYAPGKEGLVE
jgi:hypothetical protein